MSTDQLPYCGECGMSHEPVERHLFGVEVKTTLYVLAPSSDAVRSALESGAIDVDDTERVEEDVVPVHGYLRGEPYDDAEAQRRGIPVLNDRGEVA